MRPLPLLLPAVLAGLLASAAPGRAEVPPRCVHAGERTEVAGVAAVVVRADAKRRVVWWACDPATGRRHRMAAHALGPFRALVVLRDIEIAGSVVTWGQLRSDRYTTSGEAHLLDVRDGSRAERDLGATENVADLAEVAIDHDGRAAYLTRESAVVLDGEVHRTVDRARPELLADLRLDGDQVTWRHGDVARSAPALLDPGACPGLVAFAATDRVLVGTEHLEGDDDAEPAACARDRRLVVRLPRSEHRELADGLVASEIRRGIDVVDPATATRRLVRMRARGPWALAADGTVVVATGRSLVAYPPHGAAVRLGSAPPKVDRLIVDDVLGRVTWVRGDRMRTLALRPACVRPGEHVVAEGDAVVVMQRRLGPPRREPPVAYHACVRETGQRTLLSRALPSEGNGPSSWRLAGTTVAYVLTNGTRYDQTSSVAVLDATRPSSLRTREIRSPMRELVAAPGGRAAVLTDLETFVLDRNGARRLDVAVPGTLTALGLSADTVTWSHRGVPRAAPAELPASCAPPRDLVATAQGPTAVVGALSRRHPDGEVPHAMACRFDGGGWVDLGPGTADVRGEVVAVRRDVGAVPRVRVLHASTLRPLRPPVRLEGPMAVWAVAPDGTVVHVPFLGRRIAVDRPDGSLTWTRAALTTWLAVDDAARAIVADSDDDVSSAPPAVRPLPE